ncbi:hypothetical protein VSDG_00058 [Cytospora chrysosperma]|uniref:Uncharacterized protein n=1 Tax=Cytospora chrysosperma TaxID=252740 RepID=A0A423WQ06_CYTCH|nr:hypothetical protein VSDG_00058 [Valsa sordida]
MALEFQFPGPNPPIVSHETPPNGHVMGISKRSKPSTGSVAGICSWTAGFMSIVVAPLCPCGSQRRKARRTLRTGSPGSLNNNRAFDLKEEVPMSRLGHVLSKFCQRRRKLHAQEANEIPWHPHPQEASLVDLSSHRFPSVYGLQEAGTDWAQESRPYEPLPRSTMENQPYGPFPAYTPPVGNAEWHMNPRGHGPDDISYPAFVPPFETTHGMPSVPSPTMPHPADRQNRRCGLPAPLSIVPPPTVFMTMARSQSDATSAAAYLPYSPYDYYSPHADYAPVPSSPPNDGTPPSFTYGPRSLHSSYSDRSSPQPRSPISLQSTGPPPSMSRSTTSERTEPCSLPPPTPTYLQSQRAPIDTDNIICLGPLPDNISPKHLQFQPQKPRAVATPLHHGNQSSSPVWPTAGPIGPIQQDPLLHDSSPLPPYQSPAAVPVLTCEHPPQQEGDHHHHHCRGGAGRRRSVDSLGSNFTVEEEARIQAQVVRNLSMLGQERVGGEGDIVHIPQPSDRRFSFEYDR